MNFMSIASSNIALIVPAGRTGVSIIYVAGLKIHFGIGEGVQENEMCVRVSYGQEKKSQDNYSRKTEGQPDRVSSYVLYVLVAYAYIL